MAVRYSFLAYLLTAFYASSTILGTGKTKVRKRDMDCSFINFTFQWREYSDDKKNHQILSNAKFIFNVNFMCSFMFYHFISISLRVSYFIFKQ